MKRETERSKRGITPLVVSVICVALLGVAANARVAMVDSGATIELSNSEVSVTIDKAEARIIQVLHNGEPLLAPRQSGYFTLISGEDNEPGHTLRINNCSVRTHLETPETIDLAFTPESHPGFPFGIEFHYVLRDGDSGFYFYLVARKDGDT
ncbi:MAG: hypothetical protein ACYTGQ_06540, partial [Planctomycetota bacterium]